MAVEKQIQYEHLYSEMLIGSANRTHSWAAQTRPINCCSSGAGFPLITNRQCVGATTLGRRPDCCYG